MAIVVRTWTGAEARALRAARRMSLTDFAAHLGVNPRLLSRWEAGGTAIRPRPVNQAALDTVLNQLAADELARFVEAISPDALSDARDPDVPEQHTTIRHPADGKLMARIPGYRPGRCGSRGGVGSGDSGRTCVLGWQRRSPLFRCACRTRSRPSCPYPQAKPAIANQTVPISTTSKPALRGGLSLESPT